MSHLFSDRLKQHRKQANFSIQQMAEAMDLSYQSYVQLEESDLEIFMVLSINDYLKLCTLLGILPSDLFSQPIRANLFSDLIKSYIKGQKITLLDFENEVGWEMSEILNTPTHLLNYHIPALMDICHELDLSWVAVLEGLHLDRKEITDGMTNSTPPDSTKAEDNL